MLAEYKKPLRFSWVNKGFCPLMQVRGAVRSFEGLISVSGILEFLIAQAANSPPHVLHQEPGPLRGWHAYAPRETYPARLELLWILHGPGTQKTSGHVVCNEKEVEFVLWLKLPHQNYRFYVSLSFHTENCIKLRMLSWEQIHHSDV